MMDMFFVTPALSTSIGFMFFKPSVAPRTASPNQSAACRPNVAEFLNLSIKTADSSRENPRARRFFRAVAASAVFTSQSFVKFCITFSAFEKSLPVPVTIDDKPAIAFSNLLLSSIAFLNQSPIVANTEPLATARPAKAALFFSAKSPRPFPVFFA